MQPHNLTHADWNNEKISPLRRVRRYEDDPTYLLQLIVLIFITIEDARKRKKRPSSYAILRAVCDRHSLVDSVVSDAFDLLIESKGVHIKHDNKGNDSLVTNTESRDEIFDVLNKASENSGSGTFCQNQHPWQENQDASLPLLEFIEINDDDHLAKTGENSKEAVPVSDRIESPFMAELNGM